MLSLEKLYGEVDNLSGLEHPQWRCGFRYMNACTTIDLARAIYNSICNAGFSTVVVSETGASPLAEICAEVDAFEKRSIKFVPVKLPREPQSCILPVLRHFLSESERSAKLTAEQVKQLRRSRFVLSANIDITDADDRLSALEKVVSLTPNDFISSESPNVADLLSTITKGSSSTFQQAVSIVFQGSETGNSFSKPFVYLDEYIDSGTTLRNAIAYFRCFAPNPEFKVASYCLNLPRSVRSGMSSERAQSLSSAEAAVLYTRYRNEDKPGCFDDGAYPYENRVDLIGHYYRIDSRDYVKKTLVDILEECRSNEELAGAGDVEKFLSTLRAVVGGHLCDWVLARFELDEVKTLIQPEHIMRRCLFELEQKIGTADMAEFLFELFDMYGPAWTPMPVSFHFDFWNGFENFEDVFAATPQFALLCAEYRECRESLLTRLAEVCLVRRNDWLKDVRRQLEEHYGQGQSIGSNGKRINCGVHVGKSD